MKFDRAAVAASGSTTLFVLLWSSGAIFAELGLAYATPLAFLILRFAMAGAVLLAVGLARGSALPAAGTRGRVALTGALLIGGYSICYFQALAHGVTPGVLATVLGVQPILTLLWVERRFSGPRALGLALALAGLVLVVYQSIGFTGLSAAGIGFALASLLAMTAGAILQKGINQAPGTVLPLQYGVSLLLCLVGLGFERFAVTDWAAFLVPLLWLGLVISVGASLLFYRLIQAGNLVNVTSLLYLVPVGTAAMDYLFLGNPMAPLALAGMAAILAGLALVFRTA
jgi:drug/metabolite transporter (DMT)-like permease